jgi:hypothetical protein
MIIPNSAQKRTFTGTIVLTITYGFVGYWGSGIVSSAASSSLQFDITESDQDIVTIVESLRKFLTGNLHQTLITSERAKFGEHAEKIFAMYHVISEAQMFIP